MTGGRARFEADAVVDARVSGRAHDLAAREGASRPRARARAATTPDDLFAAVVVAAVVAAAAASPAGGSATTTAEMLSFEPRSRLTSSSVRDEPEVAARPRAAASARERARLVARHHIPHGRTRARAAAAAAAAAAPVRARLGQRRDAPRACVERLVPVLVVEVAERAAHGEADASTRIGPMPRRPPAPPPAASRARSSGASGVVGESATGASAAPAAAHTARESRRSRRRRGATARRRTRAPSSARAS